MSIQPKRKGPWLQRVFIFFLAIAFGVLVYWLLDVALGDISSIPGPQYADLEEQMLDPSLRSERERIAEGIDATRKELSALRNRQGTLRESTDSSQTTINQLIGVYRLALEQGKTLTDEEREAFTRSQQRFLSNQEKFQEMNAQVAAANEKLRLLEEAQRINTEAIREASESIQEEWQRQMQAHKDFIAMIRVGLLVPLAIVAGVGYLRRRELWYKPMVHAFALAVAAHFVVVIRWYFSDDWERYIFITIGILVIGTILVKLLRSIASPGKDLLLKRYREAYERFCCPVCDFPIRRGPLRFMFWTRRTIKKMHTPVDTGSGAEETYTCPSCSTKLYEQCESCDNIRASLLPACEHCGSVRELGT